MFQSNYQNTQLSFDLSEGNDDQFFDRVSKYLKTPLSKEILDPWKERKLIRDRRKRCRPFSSGTSRNPQSVHRELWPINRLRYPWSIAQSRTVPLFSFSLSLSLSFAFIRAKPSWLVDEPWIGDLERSREVCRGPLPRRKYFTRFTRKREQPMGA